MTALALAAAWAVLPLLIVAHRPPAARVPAPVTAPSGGGRHGRRRPGPLVIVGRALVVAVRPWSRSPAAPLDDEVARRLAVTAVLATVAMATVPGAAPVAGLPWLADRLRRRARERRRLLGLEAGLPEVVDLLALAVGAGANVRLAVVAAGRRGAGPLAAELRRVAAEVDAGRRLADALDDLPARAGEAARPLAAVLAGCERYGAPAVPALERLGAEVRRQRLRQAEEAARRVPVLLLFPLVLCVLPAFALLTVAPLIAGALRELRL